MYDFKKELFLEKKSIADSIYYHIKELNEAPTWNAFQYLAVTTPKLNVLNAALLYLTDYQPRDYLEGIISSNPNYAEGEALELVNKALKIMDEINPEKSSLTSLEMKPNEFESKRGEINKHLSELYDKYYGNQWHYNSGKLLAKIKVLEAAVEFLFGRISIEALNDITSFNPQYNDGKTSKLFKSVQEIISAKQNSFNKMIKEFEQHSLSQPLDKIFALKDLDNHFLFEANEVKNLSLTCKKYYLFFSPRSIPERESILTSIMKDYRHLLREKGVSQPMDLIPTYDYWRFAIDGKVQRSEQYEVFKNISDDIVFLKGHDSLLKNIPTLSDKVSVDSLQALHQRVISLHPDYNDFEEVERQAKLRTSAFKKEINGYEISEQGLIEILNSSHEHYLSIVSTDVYYTGGTAHGDPIMLDKKSLYLSRNKAKAPSLSDLQFSYEPELLSRNEMMARLDHEIIERNSGIMWLAQRIALTKNNGELKDLICAMYRARQKNRFATNATDLTLHNDLTGDQLKYELHKIVNQLNNSLDKFKKPIDKLVAIITFVRSYAHLSPFEIKLDKENIMFLTFLLNYLLIKNNFPPVIMSYNNMFYGYTINELVNFVLSGIKDTLILMKEGKLYGYATTDFNIPQDRDVFPYYYVRQYFEPLLNPESTMSQARMVLT